ncbi:hypothetical protein Ciccas_013807 [Cichlidogyrus casuarinus]|uniref:Serine/threonine-protein kinase greatwall n=1 Tax=Cichlidogyrus casuarinus TaxID=1844966 RepID=A0ABD2PKC3_9PLAT
MQVIPSVDDFVLVKPISKGAYGKVFLGMKRSGKSKMYAIKIISKDDLIKKNLVNQGKSFESVSSFTFLVTAERNALAVSKCPFIVMEYLIGGDLKNLLMVAGYLDDDHAAVYLAEISTALQYLHRHGIIHHDLKPDNILITDKGHLKLTDFGLSSISWAHPIRTSDVLHTPSFRNIPAQYSRTPGQLLSLTSCLSFVSFATFAFMIRLPGCKRLHGHPRTCVQRMSDSEMESVGLRQQQPSPIRRSSSYHPYNRVSPYHLRRSRGASLSPDQEQKENTAQSPPFLDLSKSSTSDPSGNLLISPLQQGIQSISLKPCVTFNLPSTPSPNKCTFKETARLFQSPYHVRSKDLDHGLPLEQVMVSSYPLEFAHEQMDEDTDWGDTFASPPRNSLCVLSRTTPLRSARIAHKTPRKEPLLSPLKNCFGSQLDLPHFNSTPVAKPLTPSPIHKPYSQVTQSDRLLGTPEYLAPECLLSSALKDSVAVDWWSLGVILFEMLTGSTPFCDDSVEAIFQNILSGGKSLF